jgi:hypothetical protein
MPCGQELTHIDKEYGVPPDYEAELTRLREERVQMLAASAERVQMDGAEIARLRHLSIGRDDLEYLARELVGAILDALDALADALEEKP